MFNSQEEAYQYLKRVVTELLQPPLDMLCSVVIGDPRFTSGFGSANKHHSYVGGLMVHTAEVVKLVRSMVGDADVRVLTVAAIYHDYHKIYDYEIRHDHVKMCDYIAKTDHHRLIGHVAGSYTEFVIQSVPYTQDVMTLNFVEQVGHCILSHHGRKEWGSPVVPATKEAFILHAADMISSQIK